MPWPMVTGKGNDQVRFDVGLQRRPDLKVLTPAREWGMSRERPLPMASVAVFQRR